MYIDKNFVFSVIRTMAVTSTSSGLEWIAGADGAAWRRLRWDGNACIHRARLGTLAMVRGSLREC